MKILISISIFQIFFLVPFFSFSQKIDSFNYGLEKTHGKYLSLRGFKMYYEIYGKGKPMLFIHGNGGSIKDFQNQIPYFSSRYMVIAADSRSQGKSTDLSDSLSFEMMADDFNVLLDSLHLDSCFVVGWSDGGVNALLLTLRHPKKVKKLVIVGANLWPDTTALKPFLFYALRDEHNSKSVVRQTSKEINNHKLKDLDYLQPNISLAALKTMQCPTLVISGDHDIIQLSHTVAIAENIKNSYLWIVPNSGHAIPVNKHAIFNKEVSFFFANPYHAIEGFESFN